jgi:hypothetical protein
VAEFPPDGGTRFVVTLPSAVHAETPVTMPRGRRARRVEREEVDV